MIDPSTPVGKVRLRVADTSDLPFLPDSVYTQTIEDTNGNLPKAAAICASYILGMLAFRTHRKLQQLEVWGAEAFTNYMKFLEFTISNPQTLTGYAPIPYTGVDNCDNPLVTFVADWNANYASGTQSQQLARDSGLPHSCCTTNSVGPLFYYDPITGQITF